MLHQESCREPIVQDMWYVLKVFVILQIPAFLKKCVPLCTLSKVTEIIVILVFNGERLLQVFLLHHSSQ